MKEKLSLGAALIAISALGSEGCLHLAHMSPTTQEERKEEVGKLLKQLGVTDTGKQPDGGQVQCILYKKPMFEGSIDIEIREMQLCSGAKLNMIARQCSSTTQADQSIETKGVVYGSRCDMKETRYDDRMGMACVRVGKPDKIECN